MKDRATFLLKLLISVGLLAYLFARIGGVHQPLMLMRSARVEYVVLALCFYTVALGLSSVKWWILLRAQGVRVPLSSLVAYTFLGAFFNNFLPANVGGDVMRGYGLARHTQHRTDAAVSIVMDRLVGLLAFLTAAVLAGSVVLLTADAGARATPALRNVRALTGIAWAGEVGLVVGTGILLSRRIKRWMERGMGYVPLIRNLVPLFQRVTTAINAYRHAYGAILLGMSVSWTVLFLTTVENWLLVEALAPGAMPFPYLLLLNPLIAFALLIPLSVGGLGIGQSAYVFFFGLVGIAPATALAISLLHQVIVYVGSLPGAILWLYRR